MKTSCQPIALIATSGAVSRCVNTFPLPNRRLKEIKTNKQKFRAKKFSNVFCIFSGNVM